MRVRRLVIESNGNSFTLDLHRRMTVIAGLGPFEREALLAELVGSLGASRPGVHLEIEYDNGTHLAIFRPPGEPTKVVDVYRSMDVTEHFVGPDGRVDLLACATAEGLSPMQAIAIRGSELLVTSQSDQYLRRLALTDQEHLWVAADRVRTAEIRLAEVSREAGAQPADAAAIEQIEHRHAEIERTQARHERLRRIWLWVGALAATAAAATAIATNSLLAGLPLMLTAIAVSVWSYVEWRRLEQSRTEEQGALAAAGARSYLGFHLQRVNSLLADGDHRRRLLMAAEDHRLAEAEWQRVAGGIPASWALENVNEIREMSRIRDDIAVLSTVHEADEAIDEASVTMTRALMTRLRQVRHGGPDGISLPLILDEPFDRVPESVKPALLETLMRAGEHQQVVLLSQDPAVASWARLEMLTGDLSVLEPAPTAAPADIRESSIPVSGT